MVNDLPDPPQRSDGELVLKGDGERPEPFSPFPMKSDGGLRIGVARAALARLKRFNARAIQDLDIPLDVSI